MAKKIDTTIRITAEDRTKKGFGRASKNAKTLQKTVKSTFNSIKISALAAGAAVIGLGTAYFKATKSVVDQADKIGKLSLKYGILQKDIQVLNKLSADQGQESQKVFKAISTLERRAAKATNGMATYAKAFDGLGLSLKNTDGSLKDSTQLTRDLGDILQKTGINAKNAGFLMDVLGTDMYAFNAVVGQGTEFLDEYEARMRKLGGVIDDDLIDKGEELASVWTNTTNTMSARFNTLVLDISGSAEELASWGATSINVFSATVHWAVNVVKAINVVVKMYNRLRAESRTEEQAERIEELGRHLIVYATRIEELKDPQNDEAKREEKLAQYQRWYIKAQAEKNKLLGEYTELNRESTNELEKAINSEAGYNKQLVTGNDLLVKRMEAKGALNNQEAQFASEQESGTQGETPEEKMLREEAAFQLTEERSRDLIKFKQDQAGAAKAQARAEQSANQQIYGSSVELARGLGAVASAAFKDNKDVQRGNVLVNTAAAIANALAFGVPPVNYINAAAAGAIGAAQLIAINSASPSGGASASVGAPPSAQAPDQNINASINVFASLDNAPAREIGNQVQSELERDFN